MNTQIISIIVCMIVCMIVLLSVVYAYMVRRTLSVGMKYFAMALVRSLLPILRHRLAKVRAAACSCVRACIMVPDLDKCKGAGSDCIPELIGFREENNLSVASFYTAEIRLILLLQ